MAPQIGLTLGRSKDRKDEGCTFGYGERALDGGRGWCLMPCLPNDVVLEHVVTKVSWNTICTLACVNQTWRRVIRSRQVYEGRKRSSSTQSLILFRVPSTRQYGFYNFQQQEFFLLPPHAPPDPVHENGGWESAVFMDGKLFVVADLCPGSSVWTTGLTMGSIQVLDVAACQQVWKDFSSPKANSYSDICVPCDDKIYVFHVREYSPGKMFDPANDTWNDVADRPVDPMGDGPTLIEQAVALKDDIFLLSTRLSSMVFNTRTETWRYIRNNVDVASRGHWVGFMTRCVVMDGKLYRFSHSAVDVLRIESGSWTFFQSTSLKNIEPPNPRTTSGRAYGNWPKDGGLLVPVVVTPFGSEVLAIFQPHFHISGSSRILCRSVGFGVKDKCLLWEKLSGRQLPPEAPNKDGSFSDFLLATSGISAEL